MLYSIVRNDYALFNASCSHSSKFVLSQDTGPSIGLENKVTFSEGEGIDFTKGDFAIRSGVFPEWPRTYEAQIWILQLYKKLNLFLDSEGSTETPQGFQGVHIFLLVFPEILNQSQRLFLCRGLIFQKSSPIFLICFQGYTYTGRIEKEIWASSV